MRLFGSFRNSSCMSWHQLKLLKIKFYQRWFPTILYCMVEALQSPFANFRKSAVITWHQLKMLYLIFTFQTISNNFCFNANTFYIIFAKSWHQLTSAVKLFSWFSFFNNFFFYDKALKWLLNNFFSTSLTTSLYPFFIFSLFCYPIFTFS